MVTASFGTRPPVTGVVRSSFDLLEIVDGLPDDATGELVLRDGAAAVVGIVFVERARVCWIAARGFAGRLSDLLRARTQPILDERSMESVYRRCRAEGERLGEFLVSRGLLAADDLREALLHHSIECLSALGETKVSARFSARSGAGYAADFTFDTSEIATATGVLANGYGAPEIEVAFLRSCEPRWGAIYARNDAYAQPLPLVQIGDVTGAKSLLGVGRWAASVLDLGDAVDPGPRMLTFADHAKGGSVLWTAGGCIGVACFVDQAQFSRAMSRRATRSP